MEAVLGIDLGTSYIKASVVGKDGTTLGYATTPVQYDRDSRYSTCTLPVHRFISAVVSAIAGAFETGGGAARVIAVSSASQANTFVLLDSDGEPLDGIVSWQDQRAGDPDIETKAFAASDVFLSSTGMGVFSGGAAAVKLSWYRRQRPELWKRVAKILNISDFLTYLLTGLYAADGGTASLSGLLEVKHNTWWPAALEHFGVSIEMLPDLYRPGAVIGPVTQRASGTFGIPPQVPVVAGSLDHHAAALGSGVGSISDASESTGTVIAALRLAESYKTAPGTTTGPGHIPGNYFRLSFADGGGSLLQAYRDNHAPDLSLADLDRLAENVPRGAGGLTEAYTADDTASAYPGDHGRHARGIMEAIALRLKTLVETLYPREPLRALSSTGGGARSDVWSRIKAQELGCRVITLEESEPACRGAALIAGTAIGRFKAPIPGDWYKIRRVYIPGG